MMHFTQIETEIPGVTYGNFVRNLFRVLPTPAMMYTHAILGVATEMTELDLAKDEANFIEELVDLLFFIAAALQMLESLHVADSDIEELTLRVFRECTKDADILGLRNPKRSDHTRALLTPLLDSAKRWMAYDKAPTPKDVEQIAAVLGMVAVHASSHPAYGFDIYSRSDFASANVLKVIRGNVAKLRHRYKGGFSTEAAVNRDVVGEMDALKSAAV
jgi:hypothetical protein